MEVEDDIRNREDALNALFWFNLVYLGFIISERGKAF